MSELEKYKEAVKEIALNGEDFFRRSEHDISVLATAVYLILEQIVDRKTESDSEKPNSCEWSVEYAREMLNTMPCEECGHWVHGAGDHYYCALLEMRQECYFESKNESTLMFANEPKTEPQTERSSE